MLLIALLIPAASAVGEPASVDVTVSIEHGGTAVIIPQVNCPVPAVSLLVLEDGEVGAFHIEFEEEGEYTYSIMQMPDDRDITFDTTVFTVKLTVGVDDGELSAIIAIYNASTGKKVNSRMSRDGWDLADIGEAAFHNLPVSPTDPTETTEPTETTSTDATDATIVPGGVIDDGSSSTDSSSTSLPQTGDDRRMERYFLLAILASAGLFILSLVYTRNTNKLLRGS